MTEPQSIAFFLNSHSVYCHLLGRAVELTLLPTLTHSPIAGVRLAQLEQVLNFVDRFNF